MFGKSRKPDVQAMHWEIATVIIASRQQKMGTMSKFLHVLRKTLHKHTKFRVLVIERDETLLRQAYNVNHNICGRVLGESILCYFR